MAQGIRPINELAGKRKVLDSGHRGRGADASHSARRRMPTMVPAPPRGQSRRCRLFTI
ncbi:hypothetical protein L538_0261 [Bordetella hinzii 4161]|nr:hypothetical protein L538_0261 [Bordetella hinzii 4161]